MAFYVVSTPSFMYETEVTV